MARRRNLSDALETRFACHVSWDDMSGGADRRFCGQCRCEVFDFAQMEPRAVKARLEASRGRLCARLTRVAGRIQMLAPPSPPAAEAPRRAERAPAIAAGLFGAWLSLAAAHASASPSPAPVAAAPAEPRDGEALLATRFSAAVEVTASRIPVHTVSTGMLVSWDGTLRELFDESDLVFAGRVESSRVLAVNDGIAEVHTVLLVAHYFKGGIRDRFVTYRHSLPAEAFGPGQEPLPELTPGSMMVAFLVPAEEETGRTIFEATSYSGLRGFAADDLEAYAEQLEELAALSRLPPLPDTR